MRYSTLILLLLLLLPVSVQNARAQGSAQIQNVLIQKIQMQGFVLDDSGQFVRLFKPYRNKHLSAADIDAILQQIQKIYEQAGYQGLVSIGYQIKRKSLTFTVSLIK